MYTQKNQKSLTVPKQTMSIKEMLRRSLTGEHIPVQKINVFYDGNVENVTFDDIDPTLNPAFDLSDFASLNREIEEKNAELKKAKKAKEVEEANRIKEELEDLRKLKSKMDTLEANKKRSMKGVEEDVRTTKNPE